MALRTTLAAAALFVALTSSSPLPIKRQSCSSAPYIIVARGSEEDPGEGKPAVVAQGIQQAIPAAQSVAVDYPASVGDPAYPDSVSDGITNTIDLIHSYVDACGDQSNIILVGYSQGGNVMTDVLAGGVDKPAVLSAPYTQYIKGVAVFGDPSFTAGQSFDRGTSTSDGIFAREEGGDSLALLNTYADIIVSYCDDDDLFCASGDSASVHENEVPNHASDAIQFLLGLQGQ